MGCLKTLACAGAVAMVASSALFAAPASAADLGAPPPMVAPPPPPMVDGMSGLYLRGDIGYSNYGSAEHAVTFRDTTVLVPAFQINQSSFDNVALAGVGIGYQFNSWLRFDVTGEFRTSSRFQAIESYQNIWTATCSATGAPGGRCFDTYGASIGTNVFMANGYVDLGNWGGFQPFVGAGVGYAYHKVRGLYDYGPQTGGFGYASDTSKSNLAWALMAGVGFDVTRNLKLEVGYRYLDMGDVTTNPILCQGVTVCPQETHRYSLNSHDVKIGFRYMFGGDVAPAPSAPLIRKF